MEKIKVEFETITPLWTGDAWGQNSEIKPSSVMGSLRFWFEVYCHFEGIEVKEKEELKDKDYQKILKSLKRDIDEGKNIDDIDKYIFDRLPLTLPSKIFGCTGWKSRIEIEGIYFSKNDFGNKLELSNKICIKKKTKGKCPSRSNNYWSVWYLPKPYFFGKFEIIFKTTQDIKENILLPLLNFIQKYGFIGAKNNIGYGRVKVLEPDISSYDVIKTSEFVEKDILLKEIFEEIQSFDIQKLDNTKIQIFLSNFKNDSLNSLIKGLLTKKARLRRKIEGENQRHFIFGFTSKNKNEATKIIPLITQNNKEYEGNFLSIIGIKFWS